MAHLKNGISEIAYFAKYIYYMEFLLPRKCRLEFFQQIL